MRRCNHLDRVRDTNATMVASLLQPIPEVFELFDNVILLQEGHLVYAGHRAGALPFLESQIGVQCPEDEDICEFIVSYLGDPNTVVQLVRMGVVCVRCVRCVPGAYCSVVDGTSAADEGGAVWAMVQARHAEEVLAQEKKAEPTGASPRAVDVAGEQAAVVAK